MQEIASKDAKNNFGQLLDDVQAGPVKIIKNGRAVGVIMSVEQHERLRGAVWERLTTSMDGLSEEAAKSKLAPADLDALLTGKS